MFQNINIGSRLGIGLISIFLILISLILFGINRMNLLSSQTVQMYNHPLTVSNAVLRINANIIKIHRSMKDVALAQDLASIEETVHIVYELEKDIYKDFEIINLRFLGDMKNYESALEVFVVWKPIRDNVIALMRTGQSIKAADITKGEGALHVVKIEKVMEALSNFAQKKAAEFLNTTESSRISAFNTMYVSLIIALIVSVICAIYLTKSITVPLKTVTAATNRIGKGKLDIVIDIKSKDEIGQLADSFNKMIRDLKNVTASRDELNTEINERKRAESGLKKSEMKFRQLVDNINEIFWLENADATEMLYVSPAYERIMGRTCQSLYDNPKAWLDAIHPDDQQKVLDSFLDGRHDGTYSEEFRIIRPDGSIRWIWDRSFPVHSDKGEIRRIAGIAEDITQRKQAEDEREQLNIELKRSNKELEQFAYMASHDLKSPLVSISGFAALLRKDYEDKLDKNAHEYIDFIVSSIKRMDTLINGLLTYSRIGVGSSKLKIVDVNKVFVRAIANLTVDIERNKAKITHDSLPTVLGNDVQLEQLLQNLIGNAIKFHNNESQGVHISAKQNDGNWVFSVKDNGIGIASENREKIFDMFQCLDRDKYKGTGIGLAACKKIVELHGGKIWVESQLNTGSIFYFTIPITSAV
jgi:PAS domain S-box-containing protein